MIGQDARSFLLFLTHALAELCSAENMKMKMLDRLASIGAAVCDHTVTAAEILALGDLGYLFEYLCDVYAVFRIDLINGRDVNLRHQENMYGSLRINITESINVFVLINLRRRNVTLDDLAE